MVTDPIEERLRTLTVDVDALGTPDSGAVRRRGDQRVRHQAIGSALGVVAVAVGLAGLAGGLVGDREAVQGPPAEGPSVSTTREEVLDLAADPLLRGEDIGTVGRYGGFQRSPVAVDYEVAPLRCITSPVELGAQQVAATTFFSELDPNVRQHVLRFADAASARTALAVPATDFATCPQGDPAQEEVTDRPGESLTVADEALRASRSSIPQYASEPFYYELALVREDNVVVVLEWTSMGRPDGVAWVWTEQRLETALERALG